MKNDPPNPPPEAASPGGSPAVGLREIIQMECVGGNSSVLEIYNQSELGRIYIQSGKVVHATFNDVTGERAFSQLLNLAEGAFELSNFEPPPETSITTAWPALLAQALHVSGEATGPKAANEGGSGSGAQEAGEAGPRVEEKVFCSPKGEVFYTSQCSDIPGRIAWMQAVVQHAEQFGRILPLGDFDRMSIATATGRIIMRARADNLAFVQVVTESKPA